MTDAPRFRWFHPKPSWLIVALLFVECLLFLSERFRWAAWHKGYAVLTAVACVGVVFLAMLLWLVIALIFRRHFQFSIRSLLVLTVAVAIPCSWMAVEVKAAREQHDAVEAIVKVGGQVGYDWQSAQPTCPAWLRGLLGNDFVAQVDYVHFVGGLSQFTEARQGRLRCLTQIKKLMLFSNNGEATDADLKCLAGLPQLRELQCFTARDPSAEMKTFQQALPNCKVQVIFDIQQPTPR